MTEEPSQEGRNDNLYKFLEAFRDKKFIIGRLSEGELDDIVWLFISQGGGKYLDVLECNQYNYLKRYLNELAGPDYLNKEEIYYIVEFNYVDKDFLDDYSRFYAKCLRDYPKKCLRVHFFAQDRKTTIELRELLESAIQESVLDETERKTYKVLQENYWGFTVIKPLAEAFMGKTVLRVYPQEASPHNTRHYTCTREYKVSLAGIPLKINGLAFQQQDATIAACATTAVWSALHKAAFDAEYRIPTPGEITEGATQFNVGLGRQFPTTGLTAEQICEAIHSFGLAPELISLEDSSPDYLKEIVHCYLCSEIPIIAILNLYKETEPEETEGIQLYYKLSNSYHAVTLLGFRSDTSQEKKNKIGTYEVSDNPINVFLESSQIEKLYAHDDRLGSYLKLQFVDEEFLEEKLLPDKNMDNHAIYTKDELKKACNLKIEWPPKTKRPELVRVTQLIVPVYHKLRLQFATIRNVATSVLRTIERDIFRSETWIESSFPLTFNHLKIRYSFLRGRNYTYLLQQEFLALGFSSSDILNLLEPLRLSRQVGICDVQIRQADGNYTPFMDIVFDTTESRVGWPISALILKDDRLLSFREGLSRIVSPASVYCRSS